MGPPDPGEVAQKIQSFQIASYESLANLAARLDLPPIAKLLRDNLQERRARSTSLHR
jgi:ferritin-like metal-binding protein YciE